MIKQKYLRIPLQEAINIYSFDTLYNYYILEHHSFKECQKKFNMSQLNLSKLFKYYNIVKSQDDIKKTYTRTARLNQWSSEVKEQFKIDYQNNMSYDDLKIKYKIGCNNAIYDIVDELDIPRRKSNYFRVSFDDVLVIFNEDFDKNKELIMSSSRKDLAKLFNTSLRTIDKLIDYLGIREDRNKKIKILNAKKGQNTKLERYGDKNYHNVEQMKKTNLEKYGREAFVNMKKTAQTKLERYGDPNYNNRDKVIDTCLKRYGVEHYTNPEKCKQTCLEKYGVEYSSQDIHIREKISNSQIKCGNLKGYNTKKKNNTLNSSKIEKYFIEKLKPVYQDDIFYQYRQDKRYPFNCDFYIKSLDLFIELNLHWTHGKHRFNPNNEEDLKQLEIWEEKSKKSNFYVNAIKNWSIRDVEKFETAEKNNLNYKVFYLEQDVYKFIDELLNFKNGQITMEG